MPWNSKTPSCRAKEINGFGLVGYLQYKYGVAFGSSQRTDLVSRNIFANFCVTYCWRQAERQGPFTSLFFVLGHCQVFGDSIFVRKMPYTSGIFFSVLIHSYIRWSQNLVSWPHVPFCFLLGHMYHYGMCYILHNCYSIALSYGIDKTETLYAHKHTVLEQKNTQIHKYKNRKTQKDKCKMFGRWM